MKRVNVAPAVEDPQTSPRGHFTPQAFQQRLSFNRLS
jgi:hypothetical protein